MAEVRLQACDICGKHEGMPKVKIHRVRLEVDEDRAKAVLCGDCVHPVTETMKRLPDEARRARQRRDFERLMVDDPSKIPHDGTST